MRIRGLVSQHSVSRLTTLWQFSVLSAVDFIRSRSRSLSMNLIHSPLRCVHQDIHTPLPSSVWCCNIFNFTLREVSEMRLQTAAAPLPPPLRSVSSPQHLLLTITIQSWDHLIRPASSEESGFVRNLVLVSCADVSFHKAISTHT